MAELKISDLDDSINRMDVALAIGKLGDTSWLEIKTGEIRRTQRGMGMLWARCPFGAAIKAEIGQLMVEWFARVELPRCHPLQCFRCLAVSHVRNRCPSAMDRDSACHNCGGWGGTYTWQGNVDPRPGVRGVKSKA